MNIFKYMFLFSSLLSINIFGYFCKHDGLCEKLLKDCDSPNIPWCNNENGQCYCMNLRGNNICSTDADCSGLCSKGQAVCSRDAGGVCACSHKKG